MNKLRALGAIELLQDNASRCAPLLSRAIC